MQTQKPDLEGLRIEDRPERRASRGPLLLVAVLLLAAGFGAGWLLHGGGVPLPGRKTAVRTEEVRRKRAARRAGFTEGGWIEVPSYHPIVVSSLIPGRVEELTVLEGSPVEKGQVVARIYSKDLEDSLRVAAAEVEEARAALDLYRAGYRTEDVEKAKAEVERIAAEVELAEKVAARTRELVPTGAASAEELERHESDLRVAKARRKAAEEELARLTAGFRKEEVEQARATLKRAEAARDLAESRLSYAEVKSPADGVVFERFVTPGSWLTDKDPRVVSLYDPKDLQVRVDVRLENSERVRVGQEVEISTEAEPGRTYRGTVVRVDPMADLKKNTVQAKIRLMETGPRLHPEMICRARFAEEDEEPAGNAEPEPLTVPGTAVVDEGGSAFVYLVVDGRVRRVGVRTGETRGTRVVVLSGLSEGDRVVVEPPAGLRDGDEVEE